MASFDTQQTEVIQGIFAAEMTKHGKWLEHQYTQGDPLHEYGRRLQTEYAEKARQAPPEVVRAS